MSFLLWHRDRRLAFGSTRRVLRAREVPLCADAEALRDRIEQLHDETSQRAAAAEEQARAQGHAAGRAEGLLKTRDELAEAVLALTRDAARERDRVRAEIAALALEVARKLMGQLPPDGALVALAEAAARDMLPAQAMTLVVHPQRCDAVRGRLAALAAAAPGETAALRFEVRGDAACALDTCLIETDHGSVDASLDAQLERLARAWGVGEPAGAPKEAA
jgi:flagellar biosynthesis/type III secretory pathway protein FliH